MRWLTTRGQVRALPTLADAKGVKDYGKTEY